MFSLYLAKRGYSSCTHRLSPPSTDRELYASSVRLQKQRDAYWRSTNLTAIGGVGYLLVKELWETYPLVDEAVALIRDDPMIQGSLGRQLSVFGPGDGRRRRPLVHTSLGPGGQQLLEASFYVQGEQGARGKVNLRAIEKEPGKWEKQLLAVDIPGHPTHYLIQTAPLKVRAPSSTWNPFSRWFSQ